MKERLIGHPIDSISVGGVGDDVEDVGVSADHFPKTSNCVGGIRCFNASEFGLVVITGDVSRREPHPSIRPAIDQSCNPGARSARATWP